LEKCRARGTIQDVIRKTSFVFALTLLLTVLFAAQPSHALDRRLKLMFKTAGYGAAAGALIGGAVTALGVGDIRNVFMGASSGMYAGILLAAYIVATPPNRDAERRQNPYSPRRRVGPNDWENEGWEEEDFNKTLDPYVPERSSLDQGPDSSGEHPNDRPVAGSVGRAGGVQLSRAESTALHQSGVSIWMPLVTLGF